MKLDEALKGSPKPKASDHAVTFLHGAIDSDSDDDYFRLYRHPQNRRSYLLIRKEDVDGETHKWSDQEMAHAGFVGASMHTVPLKVGAHIHAVAVRMFRAGEPITGVSRTSKQADDQVCCCSASCSDTGSCEVTSAENCKQFGVVCPGSC
jgi:hypothetical protein